MLAVTAAALAGARLARPPATTAMAMRRSAVVYAASRLLQTPDPQHPWMQTAQSAVCIHASTGYAVASSRGATADETPDCPACQPFPDNTAACRRYLGTGAKPGCA